ncbi:MAG: hypothetical protein J6S64_01225 [Bacteroidales bacterium]|nr:hypothetical protein [Bacteroidales bacterium]
MKDWLHNNTISSNVATGRYISLDIPKDEYDMYVNLIDINFVSSGKVIPIVEEIYQWNYSKAAPSKDYFMQNNAVNASNDLRDAKGIARGTAGDNVIKGWVTVPDNTSYLRINHAMDNRMMINNAKNSAFDMAPYVYRVRLHLEEAGNDTSFDRTVTVTQYPSLYVVNKVSNGYTFVNTYGNADGSVICYDDRGKSSSDYELGDINNQAGSLNGTANNDNPNNYIITTSILSGTNFILGDPRSAKVNNLSNLGGLTNYRPTAVSGTENMIAPKLLVASSYGVMTGSHYVLKDAAEKRCAAYQENGYPAGRWRVPTAAEIIFMTTLSQYEFIPSLFSFYSTDNQGNISYYRETLQDLQGYWSANGKIIGTRTSTSNPFTPSLSLNTNYNRIKTAVRCVYDAWYWGEEQIDNNNNPTTTSPATTWRGYHDK